MAKMKSIGGCPTTKNKGIGKIINVKKKCKNKSKDGDDEVYANPFVDRSEKFKPTIFFEILIGTTVAVMIYLIWQYTGDPTTGIVEFCYLNIWFCLIGRYIYGVVLDFSTRLTSFKFQKYNEWHTTDFWDLGLGFALFVLIMITQIFLRPIKLNVTALDQFLFYVFTASAEEAFFRYLLTGLPILLGIKIIKSIDNLNDGQKIAVWKETILKLVVALATGSIFGIAHSSKYVEGDLIAIWVNGIEISLFFAFTKRIDVAMIGHLMLNMSFGVQILLGNV